MIFISGVHGVGKTYFCNQVSRELGIKSYTASELIEIEKHTRFNNDKLALDIDDNQQYLTKAINRLRLVNEEFMLDGHFCLLDEVGQIKRIPKDTFISLRPDVIVLLMEEPEIIASRRKRRDNVAVTVNSIETFQNEEKEYAKYVSELLGINLFISKGADDTKGAISFLKQL